MFCSARRHANAGSDQLFCRYVKTLPSNTISPRLRRNSTAIIAVSHGFRHVSLLISRRFATCCTRWTTISAR